MGCCWCITINRELRLEDVKMTKNVQYITDQEGHRTAVILPINDFEEMLEDLHLGAIARRSDQEPKRPFMDMVEEMRALGDIDV